MTGAVRNARGAGGAKGIDRRLPERRSVAITGAASFLGRNLVGLLEEDPTVGRIVLLDVTTPRTAGKKTRSYRIDLTDPSAGVRVAETLHAEKVDTVAHLAFLALPTAAEGWAHELESVGTMHVAHACRDAKVRRMVMASSTLLYGPHPSNPNFLDEGRPLRGIAGCHFLSDKIEAEREAQKLSVDQPDTDVVVLRFAPILGPTVTSWVTRWLSRRLVPTMLGHDPLVQMVHEVDAVSALRMALDVAGARGAYNIVGDGVLPISTVVKLAGRALAPLPRPLLRVGTAALWTAGLNEAPAFFVDLLRYLCVADGTKAARELGWRASYTAREAVLDFGGALRLREARLLGETGVAR
jgi:UDP-glucose 4-epimerase